MALNSLKGVKAIGGYPLVDANEIPEESQDSHNFKEYLTTNPIVVDHDWNMIMFKLQEKPAKEAGVNGCQVDTLIHAAIIILEGLDKEAPSDWNKRAIINLRDATHSLEKRKQERESRGVEGTSKE